jgi:hypothetical protein
MLLLSAGAGRGLIRYAAAPTRGPVPAHRLVGGEMATASPPQRPLFFPGEPEALCLAAGVGNPGGFQHYRYASAPDGTRYLLNWWVCPALWHGPWPAPLLLIELGYSIGDPPQPRPVPVLAGRAICDASRLVAEISWHSERGPQACLRCLDAAVAERGFRFTDQDFRRARRGLVLLWNALGRPPGGRPPGTGLLDHWPLMDLQADYRELRVAHRREHKRPPTMEQFARRLSGRDGQKGVSLDSLRDRLADFGLDWQSFKRSCS